MSDYLSEWEAWLFMAELWKDAVDLEDGSWGVRYKGFTAFGMCHLLPVMPIHISTRLLMGAKIEDVMNQLSVRRYRYLFPTTEEGAKQRVVFCLEQAAKIERACLEWSKP